MNTNTHELFNTVSHEHLDDFILFVTGKYPDSCLGLVECKNGLWFIEQDFGNAFDSMTSISRPKIFPYNEPKFFKNRSDAFDYALNVLIQHYKITNQNKIDEYLKLNQED
ncbi:TPA: hypothetical protein JBF89_13340 [Legionella pneumophila]|nr:hypothetical protein [Legionella pneumophila]HAU0349949.1 hypothetical protein [Legionella pneumophila]HAU0353440.1 hypothetical protein [Legionella pneumophila]HAU0359529.1 hypothetical protein [Legionella pneumophila]HAU0368086.1 hypothetical protein [Legionella pneumophila]